MVKYHTDEEITLGCMEMRAYPQYVVQQLLKVEQRENILNGVLNVDPDGIQPPKSISMMASAFEYSNPAVDASVYSNMEIMRIKNKMDSQLIMENLQMRGAMIPNRLYGKSRLEQDQLKRTKDLEYNLAEDNLKNLKLDKKEKLEYIKQSILTKRKKKLKLVMSGENYENPGEQGFTFSHGLTTSTAISNPNLFVPSKVRRQKNIVEKAEAGGISQSSIIRNAQEGVIKLGEKEILKDIRRPVGRTPKGLHWDANRGMWVSDPRFKGINFLEKEEGKLMREADYEGKAEQMKERLGLNVKEEDKDDESVATVPLY